MLLDCVQFLLKSYKRCWKHNKEARRIMRMVSGPFFVKCACVCHHHTAWKMRYLSHRHFSKLLLWESHCLGPDGGERERERWEREELKMKYLEEDAIALIWQKKR